jgi:hypothetical protein
MPYSLGGVKPHVKAAANYFGPKHGITTIYGVGPGSVSNSDHPKGLALDFMTSNRNTGDALSSDLIANAGKWNIKYIIWYRQIWQNGKWSHYSGPRPHTDHVHVSFNPGGTAPDVENVDNPLIPDKIESLLAFFRSIDTAFDWITKKENWTRITLFVVGFIIAFIGLIRLDKTGTAAKAVSKGVSYAKP